MKCLICGNEFQTKFVFEKYCLQCKKKAKRIKNKEWYEKNKKELSELSIEDYKHNTEKYLLRMKKYREQNKEKIKIMKHEYYIKHKGIKNEDSSKK